MCLQLTFKVKRMATCVTMKTPFFMPIHVSCKACSQGKQMTAYGTNLWFMATPIVLINFLHA